MRKLLFFFLFLPLLSKAQPKTTLIPGNNGKDTNIASVGRDNKTGNIFILHQESSAKIFSGMAISLTTFRYQWGVEVLSPDLKQLHPPDIQKLNIPKGDEILVGEVASMKGNTSLVFLLYKKKERKTAVYHASVSREGTIGALEEAGSLEGDFLELSQFMFSYSADSSLLLVAKYPSKIDPKEPFCYVILDPNGKVRRMGVFQIPKKPSDIAIGYPMVTNDGVILTPVWAKEEARLRQEVWIWGENNPGPTIVDVSLSKEQIITDLRLKQSPYDGLIYGGGTFAVSSKDAAKGMFKKIRRKNDPSPEQGTISIKLDHTGGKILSKSIQSFSPSTLSFWGKKPDILQKGDGLNSLRAVDVLPMSDGTVWVGIEQHFLFLIAKAEDYNYTPVATGTSYLNAFDRATPCSESAIFAHYSSSGEIIQEFVMGKRGSLGIGFFFNANDQGELLALYTDHEENPGKNITVEQDLEQTYRPGSWNPKKNACAAMFTTSPKGKSTTKRLFTQKDTDNWLDPEMYVQMGPNSYVFVSAGRGSSYQLLKVEW